MLRELLASFSVDTGAAVASLKKIDGAIEGAKGKLGALAEAFVGSTLVQGLRGFVEHQIELGSRVNDLSEKLGVSSDELQRFQFAAGLSGVGAEEAAKGLQFLNKNIGDAIGGNQEAIATFAKLGVTLKDGAGVRELGDMLPEIAQAFAGMGSDAERTAAAMKLFGKSGASLLPLLKEGPAGLAALSKEFDRLGGGMSKQFVQAADKAGDEIDKLKFAFNGWKSQITFAILPMVTTVATKLQGLVGTVRKITEETNLAKEAWVVFGAGATAASLQGAAGFAKFLGILPKGASFWESALGLFEIALVVAGVALLFLAFEDFFTFLTGGESIIGDLIDKFLGIGAGKDLINDLSASWALLSGLFATDLGQLKEVGAVILDVLVKKAIPYAVAGFVDMVRIVAGLVTLTGAFVKAFSQATQLDFSGAYKTLSATGKTLFGDNGLLTKSAVGNLAINDKAKALAPVDVTDSLHTGGRSGSSQPAGPVNVSNDTTITITGVKDAAAAGQAVKDGVKDAWQDNLRDSFGAAGTGG
jgi:hypothetical protein